MLSTARLLDSKSIRIAFVNLGRNELTVQAGHSRVPDLASAWLLNVKDRARLVHWSCVRAIDGVV